MSLVTTTTTLLGGPLDGQVMRFKWEERGGAPAAIHIPCLDDKPEMDQDANDDTRQRCIEVYRKDKQGRYVWQPSVSAPPAHPCK